MENEIEETISVDGFKTVSWSSDKCVGFTCQVCGGSSLYTYNDEICHNCKWEKVKSINEDYFSESKKITDAVLKKQRMVAILFFFIFVFLCFLILYFFSFESEMFFAAGYVFSCVSSIWRF